MTGIGTKGNTYYIFCTETDEGYLFDSFGKGLQITTSKSARLEIMNKYTEVDIISIVKNDTGSNVLCNGYMKNINKDYMSILDIIRKSFAKERQNNIMYSISHPEYISQVLLVFKKNTISVESVSNVLCTDSSGWLKLY